MLGARDPPHQFTFNLISLTRYGFHGETSGDFLRLPTRESTQNVPRISRSSNFLRPSFFWRVFQIDLREWNAPFRQYIGRSFTHAI